ncbi:MAG: hypothetical protein ACI90V_012532 [Bacillariaceae sp.]|jgi:hypothetical protein
MALWVQSIFIFEPPSFFVVVFNGIGYNPPTPLLRGRVHRRLFVVIVIVFKQNIKCRRLINQTRITVMHTSSSLNN